MNRNRALLYFETLKHLETGQLVNLVSRRAKRALYAPRRRVSQAAPSPLLEQLRARVLALGWENPEVLDRAAAIASHRRFTFLNRSMELKEIDWSKKYVSPLWTFHLHYFGYVEDLAWAYRVGGDSASLSAMETLVTSWMTTTMSSGGFGWAPYVVAQRLYHWSRAFLLTSESLSPRFAGEWLGSIAAQTRYLRATIEWELLGNHVIQNLRGVVAGASVIEGSDFAAIAQEAASLLAREMLRQILADGCHYERSPMYHVHVLEDLIEATDTASVMGIEMSDGSSKVIARMKTALQRLSRSDGTLHLFNDCADENPGHVAKLRSRDGSSANWSLPNAGFFGQTSEKSSFIIDCGPAGPDHQPAHAHCDILSYELDINGEPCIVDSGTGGYAGDELRSYWRSTRAHNTVQIGAQEQHELWGDFRMARRGRVRSARMAGGDDFHFEGSYSPYFSNRVLHTRAVQFRDGRLEVSDRIEGTAETATSFIHLHPSVTVKLDDGRVAVETAKRQVLIEVQSAQVARISDGWYASRMGNAEVAPVIEVTPARANEPFGYTITFPG